MSSEEFIEESNQNKNGKNAGKRSIWFNGRKGNEEYCFEKFNKYKCSSFERIVKEDPR
jgi:hypothetical protein